jgi:hypothetical protein
VGGVLRENGAFPRGWDRESEMRPGNGCILMFCMWDIFGDEISVSFSLKAVVE